MTDKVVPLTVNFDMTRKIGTAVVKEDGTVICTVTDPDMAKFLAGEIRTGDIRAGYSIQPFAAVPANYIPTSIKWAQRNCPDAESW